MSTVRFFFLADTQLGCFAALSGIGSEEAAELAARGMFVDPVPRVEGFDWDARQYRRAIEIANHQRPDFVVIGGDLIDDAASAEQAEEFLRISALLDRGIPLHWAPGNHDIAHDGLIPTRDSIAHYRDVFGADYRSFRFGEATFVVLNTVVLDQPEQVTEELEEQLAFVDAVCSAARARGSGPIVLIGHHPLFTREPDEPTSYWNVSAPQRARMLDLIRRHRVAAMFAGHWHRNAYGRAGAFEMITSGPVGYPLGFDPSGYRAVTLDASGLDHRYAPLRPGDTGRAGRAGVAT